MNLSRPMSPTIIPEARIRIVAGLLARRRCTGGSSDVGARLPLLVPRGVEVQLRLHQIGAVAAQRVHPPLVDLGSAARYPLATVTPRLVYVDDLHRRREELSLFPVLNVREVELRTRPSKPPGCRVERARGELRRVEGPHIPTLAVHGDLRGPPTRWAVTDANEPAHGAAARRHALWQIKMHVTQQI